MISGYILVNKPEGWTSFDVVKKAKRMLGAKKVGHTGTLDPFATGLLILLVNDATKQSQDLLDSDKEYIVRCCFGWATDTGDRTGKVVNQIEPNAISHEEFINKIPEMLQIDRQIPSKYSAIKISGKKAYELARKDIDFELPEREIAIHEFELIDFNFPYFTYRALVSKGTYIRTLTEQIAALFDSIAVTTELIRTRVAHYHLANAIEVADINEKCIRPLTNRPVVVIGSFDGIHLGHKYVLSETIRVAKELSAEPVVITFSPHPKEVIKPKSLPFLLTEYSLRDALFREIGIKNIEYIDFDTETSLMDGETFLQKILISKFQPQAIVIGFDSHFGSYRTGGIELLHARAKTYNYRVYELPPYWVGEVRPSSSFIRTLVVAGKIEDVGVFLGRPYSLVGRVVSGKKIGQQIGFPTINIQPVDAYKLIPSSGVYHSAVFIEGVKYQSVTNIGVSPTVKSENVTTIETHIVDFNRNIYGQVVEVLLYRKLRDEQKFSDVDSLKARIAMDLEAVKS
jgi:riboflavin kinase/FMN adenylyltransferase/tRNA pseudouridine(55) synthase